MSAGYMRRCSGKDRHEERGGADGQRRSLTRDKKLRKDALCVYRCDQCLGWHVGGSGNSFITRRRRAGKRPNKRMRGRV